MPGGHRFDAPGSYHHVMSRGIGGEEVFGGEKDAFDLLLRMHSCLKRTGTGVLAWVIMPDHFHLLVQAGGTPLSRVMSRMLTGFCMDYNQSRGRSGPVFASRFRSILVQEGSCLADLVRYIHLDPVRKGLSTPQRIGSFRWGGHREVIHPVGVNGLIDREGVLGMFGGCESSALPAYRRFIAEGMDQQCRRELEYGSFLVGRDGVHDAEGLPLDDRRYESSGAVLGSRVFARSVAESLSGMPRRRRPPGCRRDAMHAAARDVAEAFEVPLSVVRSRSQRRSALDARRVLCMVFARAGISTADAGRFLGLTQQGAWSVLRRCSENGRPELDEVADSVLERHFRDA